MYSIAMPLVVFFPIVNFTIAYWIDKAFIVKFCCKTNTHDERPILYVISMMPYGLIFHFIFGLFSLSNTSIVPPSAMDLNGVDVKFLGIIPYEYVHERL